MYLQSEPSAQRQTQAYIKAILFPMKQNILPFRPQLHIQYYMVQILLFPMLLHNTNTIHTYNKYKYVLSILSTLHAQYFSSSSFHFPLLLFTPSFNPAMCFPICCLFAFNKNITHVQNTKFMWNKHSQNINQLFLYIFFSLGVRFWPHDFLLSSDAQKFREIGDTRRPARKNTL